MKLSSLQGIRINPRVFLDRDESDPVGSYTWTNTYASHTIIEDGMRIFNHPSRYNKGTCDSTCTRDYNNHVQSHMSDYWKNTQDLYIHPSNSLYEDYKHNPHLIYDANSPYIFEAISRGIHGGNGSILGTAIECMNNIENNIPCEYTRVSPDSILPFYQYGKSVLEVMDKQPQGWHDVLINHTSKSYKYDPIQNIFTYGKYIPSINTMVGFNGCTCIIFLIITFIKMLLYKPEKETNIMITRGVGEPHYTW